MERNLVTMTGNPTTMRCVVPEPVALLFRGQWARLPGTADDEVTLHTACFRRNGSFLLPAGRVPPTQGVEVARQLVAQLPKIDLEVSPITFPDYAAPLLALSRTVSCLEQAGRILAALNLVPEQQGAAAVHTAMSDIYAAVMAAEERNPGVVYDRLFRGEKAVINWLVGLGRNVYRTAYRRTQVGQRGNQQGIFFTPFEDEPRWRHNGGQWYTPQDEACSLEDDLATFAGRLNGLALLPAQTQAILQEVGQVGPLVAAETLGLTRAEVYAAIREARALLQAQELAQSDLGSMAAEAQESIRLVAEVGLSAAAVQVGLSPDWILGTIRSGRMLHTARELLAASAAADLALSADHQHVLREVARCGLHQAAQLLGWTKTAVAKVVKEIQGRLDHVVAPPTNSASALEPVTAPPPSPQLVPVILTEPARGSTPVSGPDHVIAWTRQQHQKAATQNRNFAALWARRHPGAAATMDHTCTTCPYSCKNVWRDPARKLGGFCPILAQLSQLREDS